MYAVSNAPKMPSNTVKSCQRNARQRSAFVAGCCFASSVFSGSRMAAAHIKDIAPAGQNTDEDGWADVGQGTLPWADLFQTIKTKSAARYFVAEHDNPSDAERFARQSIATAKSWK